MNIIVNIFVGTCCSIMSVFIMMGGKLGSNQFIKPWEAWIFLALCIVGMAVNSVLFAKVYNAEFKSGNNKLM